MGDHPGGSSLHYSVRLSVPRNGTRRAWEAVRGEFERRLAEQEGGAVLSARVDSEIRRGRDYVRVVLAVSVDAGDVAEALDAAWRAFRKAAGDDAAGWDMSAAMAEVRPG